jgi:phosphatidylserine/phosphatidylglycerophosphate/cardiolipin synthase-like enzyme
MLRWVLAIACACACGRAPARGAASTPAQLELVASIPVETDLRSSLPRTDVVWVQMIDTASASLDFAEFYASDAPGSKLEPVLVAIERALRRGVLVRFLTDASLTTTYPDTLARLRNAGADVRAVEMPGDGALHAKFFVVDDREAFLGSQNFDWRALEHIVELGVRTRDPAMTAALAEIFAADWQLAGGAAPARGASTIAPSPAIVASPRDRLPAGVAWDLPKLVEMIENAQSRVRVQLLTYGAGEWTELESALVAAAARGVAIELLVSHWALREKTLGGLQQLARTNGIAVRIATIPPSSRGFIAYARVIHAKLLVVDGARAWVGTSNWERGYFYADRNVGVISEDPALVRGVGEFFAMTWSSTYAAALHPDRVYEAPRLE